MRVYFIVPLLLLVLDGSSITAHVGADPLTPAPLRLTLPIGCALTPPDHASLTLPPGTPVIPPSGTPITPGETPVLPAGSQITLAAGALVTLPAGTQVNIPARSPTPPNLSLAFGMTLTLSNSVPISLPAGTNVTLMAGVPMTLAGGTPFVLRPGAPIILPASTTLTLPDTESAAGVPLTLPAGVPVYVTTPQQAISSESAKSGDLVIFTVAADVTVPPGALPQGLVPVGTVLIPKANPVLCKVMKASHSLPLGIQKGGLAVAIVAVEAVDGQMIRVEAPPTNDNNAFAATAEDPHPLIKNIPPVALPLTNRSEPNNATGLQRNGFASATSLWSGGTPGSAQVYGRSDATSLLGAGLTVLATYAVGTLKSSTTAIDAVAVGTALSSSGVSTLFTGVPATLPAGVTYEVVTAEPSNLYLSLPIGK